MAARVLSVGEMLDAAARRHADSVCLSTTSLLRTFNAIDQRANRIASSMAARGVGKSTRVAIVANPSIEYVELILACLKLVAIAMPLDCEIGPDSICDLVERGDADFLFVSRPQVATGEQVTRSVPQPPQLLSLDGSLGDDLADLVLQGESGYAPIAVADDDVLWITFHGDAWSPRQIVLHSHQEVRAMVDEVDRPAEEHLVGGLDDPAALGSLLARYLHGEATMINAHADLRVAE